MGPMPPNCGGPPGPSPPYRPPSGTEGSNMRLSASYGIPERPDAPGTLRPHHSLQEGGPFEKASGMDRALVGPSDAAGAFPAAWIGRRRLSPPHGGVSAAARTNPHAACPPRGSRARCRNGISSQERSWQGVAIASLRIEKFIRAALRTRRALSKNPPQGNQPFSEDIFPPSLGFASAAFSRGG